MREKDKLAVVMLIRQAEAALLGAHAILRDAERRTDFYEDGAGALQGAMSDCERATASISGTANELQTIWGGDK